MVTLCLKTHRRTQFVDVTAEVQKAVKESRIVSGICHLYVPHTTAGIAISEHADPDVGADIEASFTRLIPHKGEYRHSEGNSDAHIKSVLTGTSQVIFIEGGKLALGHWQGIFFCEFDGPRGRSLYVKIAADTR